MHESTWRSLRTGAQAPKPATITKLKKAVDGELLRARHEDGVILALHRLILAVLAKSTGCDVDATIDADPTANRPLDPVWHRASQCRRLAFYVLAVELEVSNALLARALGCTRQNIKQARDAVEEKRDADPALDAALGEIARIVRKVPA